MEVGQTFNSWSEYTKCKEAFSKAASVQFCTVASRSVNGANGKVVEGQPKFEEKFKYAYYKTKTHINPPPPPPPPNKPLAPGIHLTKTIVKQLKHLGSFKAHISRGGGGGGGDYKTPTGRKRYEQGGWQTQENCNVP